MVEIYRNKTGIVFQYCRFLKTSIASAVNIFFILLSIYMDATKELTCADGNKINAQPR